MLVPLLERLGRSVERFHTGLGRLASWLYPVLMLVIVVNVVLRYAFSLGYIELEEVQWHLYSAAFLLGMAYTSAEDAHVRIDILYAAWPPRRKAWTDFLGGLFFLLPFSGLLLAYSIPYFLDSWALNERSDMPSGLPARWAIKFVLTFGLLTLFLQGVVTTFQKGLVLFRRPAD